jgi:hypothetical protein
MNRAFRGCGLVSGMLSLECSNLPLTLDFHLLTLRRSEKNKQCRCRKTDVSLVSARATFRDSCGCRIPHWVF